MNARKYKPEDLVGKVINFLTLKEHFTKTSANGYVWDYWKCECVCKNMVVRRQDSLLKGKAVSCNCKHPRRLKRADRKGQWKGCGDLDGQYVSTIRNGCKVRNIEFNVTVEELWNLFVKQGGKCALTGLPLNFCTHTEKRQGKDQSASLDRIDSDKIYVIGNLWWVHKDINRMKSDFTLERFIELCKLVVDYHNKITVSQPPTLPAPSPCVMASSLFGVGLPIAF